ncbi:VENN motif pre-toxin domain-containing protein [Dickeya chrysanthemi]|uniref:VENN motif pre-toxin domain-containing protein n=1 Tax=Dickeya chrysanthemi TaxID=556 RepID=UPI0025A2C49D|nr:VENN motif pre-toxin domain-containing protein [Dickeya chrysanthemi]WJM85365.1 VENN motif pre-toxin domain-containing protein [Dickeya chrysanthemi]
MEGLYPGKKADELNEDQRQLLSTLSTIAGGLAAGVVGNSGADAVQGAQSAQVAVENNYLSQPQQQSRSEELVACNGNATCRAEVREKYAAEYDKLQNEIANCSSPEQCVALAKELKGWQGDYSARMTELENKERNEGISALTEAEVQEWANLRGAMSNIDASRNLLMNRAQLLGG